MNKALENRHPQTLLYQLIKLIGKLLKLSRKEPAPALMLKTLFLKINMYFILVEEHKIYPETVKLYFEGRIEVQGRRVFIR